MTDAPADAAPPPPRLPVQVTRALRMLALFGGLGLMIVAGLIRCPVAFVFGVPCPGCGMTRATLRLLHGDLRGALAFHPLAPLALTFLALFFGVNTVMYIRTGVWGYVDGHHSRLFTAGCWVLVVLTLGVWISRFFGAFGGPVSVT